MTGLLPLLGVYDFFEVHAGHVMNDTLKFVLGIELFKLVGHVIVDLVTDSKPKGVRE